MEELEKQTIKISVRNLVEFVLKSGDIDTRRMGSKDKDAMQAGSKIHRKIQKRMGADYHAEVTLKHIIGLDEFTITVEGRADGIIINTDGVTIDEIKGVYFDLNYLEEPIVVHKAQAMCYGYIYSYEHYMEEIGIQITYCNIESETIKRFTEVISFAELEKWFDNVIHEYSKWARFLYFNRLRRNGSIKNIEFPFPYREGQWELAVSVYKAISRKKTLFIQAPTGIGKTLSTIFPSLKAMGEDMGDKLFYLTAKTITRAVAEESFELLRKDGLHFITVTITAKEKLCFTGEKICNPDACGYAKGHFDRVNDAVYDIIHEKSAISREEILSYAEKFKVCPFEFCLDISSWVDGIICDYNYVFDPSVRLKRFFADGVKGDYLFLVDEAHNLVPRAREMFSAELFKEDFLMTKKIIKGRNSSLAGKIEQCNKALLELKRECDTYQVLESVNHFVTCLMGMFGDMEKFMEEYSEFDDRPLVLDFYFQLRSFLTIYESLDKHYRIYTELKEDNRFMIKLLCVNPANNLCQCLEKGSSTIFFSATLLPILYYKELLSGNPEDYAVYAPSPFLSQHRFLGVGCDVSSKYTRRGKKEYEKIADYIRQVIRAEWGNYMIFFPSYQYLKSVEQELLIYFQEDQKDNVEFISQTINMSDIQKEEFLQQFEGKRVGSLGALCVMGGIFSEGIDLKEERLIGTIIIGTGLPMVCTEGEILKQYFDEAGKKGFDFAYQYPGMNKVLQAAGRVIRTAADRGIILLLDDRFLRREYLELFPREWEDYQVVRRSNVLLALNQFWRN